MVAILPFLLSLTSLVETGLGAHAPRRPGQRPALSRLGETLTWVRTYTLIGRDGRPHRSPTPGVLGGHRRTRIYGRLDCPTALRCVAEGTYVQHRVFFADEGVAIAAGYRPCDRCLPAAYVEWRAAQEG